jgi:hypothetical protein
LGRNDATIARPDHGAAPASRTAGESHGIQCRRAESNLSAQHAHLRHALPVSDDSGRGVLSGHGRRRMAGGQTIRNLEALGKDFNFAFLNARAGYDISQRLVEYTNDSTHGRALLIGLLNTLLVAVWAAWRRPCWAC